MEVGSAVSSLVAGLWFAILSATTAADVLTVDDHVGAADFLTIQAAVEAAEDGDTILVETGIYYGLVIDDRDLDIVAERSANVYVFGTAQVVNLAAGKRVLLSGLRIDGDAPPPLNKGHGLIVSACLGTVRFERCVFFGADNLLNAPGCEGLGDFSGWEGAFVTNSSDVVFSGCEVLGGNGRHLDNSVGLGPCVSDNPGGAGGTACFTAFSSVALFGSLLRGGAGGKGGSGGDGGDGYVALLGNLFASGTQISAGDGGEGYGLSPGGDGGDGIRGSTAFGAGLFDCDVTGGQEGDTDGAPGQSLAGEGIYIQEAGIARLFSSPSPTRVGELLELQFAGAPFDYVFLLVGGQDAFVPVTPFKGIVLSNTVASLGLGFLDASGQRTDSLVLAPLTGSPESLVVVLQSFHVSTSGEFRIGSAVHQVLLDPAF